MTITMWRCAFQVFPSGAGSYANRFWPSGRSAQANDPLIVDAETPASTYGAAGDNDFMIVATAEDLDGDRQDATLALGTTGMIDLPFTPFSETIFSSNAKRVTRNIVGNEEAFGVVCICMPVPDDRASTPATSV